jgi:ABC-2 type transport system permease protein
MSSDSVSVNWWCRVVDGKYLVQDIRVAIRIAALRLRGQMQYRSSFLMQISGNFIINFVEVVVLWSLFQHFDNLGGWNLQEVVFLHGLSMVMFSLGDTISNGIQTVPDLIRDGNFDRTLVRPMSAYIQSTVNEVSLRHFGHLAQGILLLGIGIASVETTWTLPKIAYMVVVILAGSALFIAIFTIEAIISFWTVNSIEAVNALTYGGSDLGQYPLHIFQRGLRFIFLVLIPIGFLTYYPSLYFLDKPDPLGLPAFSPFIAPIAAAGFCLLIGLAWSIAIRHYRSTGS